MARRTLKYCCPHSHLRYESVFRCITLTVHSSLIAVGLTAAVSGTLAAHNISANIIAAFFHDHLFVPQEDAERALAALCAI
ncbi:MAG: ACT domain-containing protein [Halioglobus sp.]|nr:ACT domain-containing protein [Halioglobus sp.]